MSSRPLLEKVTRVTQAAERLEERLNGILRRTFAFTLHIVVILANYLLHAVVRSPQSESPATKTRLEMGDDGGRLHGRRHRGAQVAEMGGNRVAAQRDHAAQ